MENEIVVLRDPATGAQAKILPAFGFNCYSFTVPHQGQPLELLWAEAGIETGKVRPSGSGIPILFPFPGRITGTQFKWEGKTYSLEAGDGRGNAIHGFVLNRAWRVLDRSAHRVTATFQASHDDPRILDQWPADFRITVTYELIGTELRSRLRIDNPGNRTLPCGLGTHPYFRLPLGGGSAGACRVTLPVQSHWELIDMLPTGKQLPLPEAASLQSGRAFAEMKYDTVMSGLRFDRGMCHTEISDPASGVRVIQSFDGAFRECVVYTPPHREAICIEPYTCVAGAFDLERQAIAAGVRRLAPGDSFEAHVNIAVATGG